MAEKEIKEINSMECAALFSLLAPIKQKRLKLQILDTLFINPQGLPLSRFYTNAQGVVRNTHKKDINADLYKDFLESCLTQASKNKPLEDGAPIPVAIARYRDKNALLTQEALEKLLETLTRLATPPPADTTAETQEAEDDEEEPSSDSKAQLPWCLQSYLAPKNGLRYISTYMWADTHIVCENYQSEFEPVYPVASKPPTAATILGPEPALELKPAQEVPTILNLSLRKTALAAVNFVHTAHHMQLLGLVTEFILTEDKTLVLSSTLAVCWPDQQVRYRDLHPEGRLFCTMPLPAPKQPLGPPRPSSPLPGTLDGSGSVPPLDFKKGLKSQSSTGGLGDTSASTVYPGTEKSVTFGALQGDRSQMSTGALTDRSDATSLRSSRKYGLESSLAAMVSPRYTDKSVWSSHIGNPAQEVLQRSAAALVGTGKIPPTYAPYHHTKRCCQPALVVDLTKRLEEVRLALQLQQQRSAEAAHEAMRWSDAAALAERDRQHAFDNLTVAMKRHSEDLGRARESEALHKARCDAAKSELAQLTEDMAKLREENEQLKGRLDYERHVSFDMTGDLKKRLSHEEAEHQELRSNTTSEIKALRAEKDALERDLSAEVTTARALARQLSMMEETVDTVKREMQFAKESVSALSRERDELLRALPGGYHEKGKAPMFAPEEIEDLLLKEQNPVAEFNIMTRIYSENAIMLRQVFRYYASVRDGPGRYNQQKKGTESISQLEFHKFCRECAIMDKLDTINIDQVFIKVNFEGERGTSGDRVIVFTEFLEALLRLAHMRYNKCAHLSQCLQEILEKNIPNCKRTRTLMPSKQMLVDHAQMKKAKKKKAAAAAAAAAASTAAPAAAPGPSEEADDASTSSAPPVPAPPPVYDMGMGEEQGFKRNPNLYKPSNVAPAIAPAPPAAAVPAS